MNDQGYRADSVIVRLSPDLGVTVQRLMTYCVSAIILLSSVISTTKTSAGFEIGATPAEVVGDGHYLT